MNLLEQATARGIEGFMHPNELEKLAELATGRDVLEIGSFKGLSAWCMAQTAHSLMCVDTFCANSGGQQQEADITTLSAFLRAVDGLDNVQYFIGTSEKAAGPQGLPLGCTFDLIFLDAMHTYEDVRDDIERWWPRVRRGGTLAIHDYGHDDFPGVMKAVDQRFGGLGYDRGAERGKWIVTLRWVKKY